MSPTRQPNSVPLLGFALVALLSWLALARAYVGCGWGWSPVFLDDTRVAYGLMAEPADSLFYLSFVEQARLGFTRFAMLFTTTEHAPVLFNPWFLVVGALARLTGWPIVFAYNVAGVIGAVLAVVFVLRCAAELELTWRARAAAAFILIFGSGLTWIARLADKLGVSLLPRGLDATFMDLFPSGAFLVYPYHACIHGGLALLLWLILRAERPARFSALRPNSATSLVPLGACAFVLATMRPYEPVLLAGVYALRTVAARFGGMDGEWRRYARIGIVMTLAFLPGLAHAAWVSRQPVWQHFSANATQLAQGRGVVLMGCALVWLLAAIGTRAWHRPWSGPAAILAWWWLAAVVLLLGLDSGAAKLAGGSMLAVALLAGAGVDRILAAPAVSRRHWLSTALATLLFIGLATTPLFLLRTFKVTLPAVDPQLLAIGEALRHDAGTTLPRVLSAPESGAVLTGLFAARSFSSHPLLTPQYARNVATLRAAGMTAHEPESSARPDVFDPLLVSSSATYVVCAADAPALALLRQRNDWTPLLELSRWSLYRSQPLPRSRDNALAR